MGHLPGRVRLMEVGPRDGLQNEKDFVPTEIKVGLVERLQDAGIDAMEVTSFVSPRWVPQMADAAAVMQGIARRPGVNYAVLVPNMTGLEAALACRPTEVVVFGAASEAFSRRNINCSVTESIERFRPVVARARAEGLHVRGVISTAVACPYEGDIAPARVDAVVRQMKDIGVQHVGIADTIGAATPRRTQAAMEQALRHFPLDAVSGHFHDTYGQALANSLACLQMGIWQFDTSSAGLGGCPYARGATGNVATEDVVYMLHGMGIETGIDFDRLVEAGAYISAHLGRPPGSLAARATLARRSG
jgi:hydroxymethylglutaryl-CoA lyase